MVREDLVNSAVQFLREPSVATATLQKKVAFLQSKNLTKEEIDLALRRAGEAPAPTFTALPPSSGYSPQATYSHSVPPPGYNPYGGYWPPPQPEVSRGDWRDWFIMATVMGGVGYGIYATAKRYLVPLIKPPTPAQLEQDKAKIDEEFNKTFALLDRLVLDTEALKASEEARTEKLDKALDEVEHLVKELRHQDRNRQETIRQTTQSVRELHDAVPTAVTAQLKMYVKPLEDEMKSLRTLIDKRLNTGSPGLVQGAGAPPHSSAQSSAPNDSSSTPAPNASSEPTASASSASQGASGGNFTPSSTPGPSTTPSSGLAAITARSSKASIPAWQKAASQRPNGEGDSSKAETSS